MTIRRVEIDVTASADQAKTELDYLKRQKDELEKPWNIRVGINLGDQTKLDKLKLSLDELNTKVAKPTVDVRGVAESLAAVIALNRELDRLNGRRVSADVSARGGMVSGLGTGKGGIPVVDIKRSLIERLGILRDVLPHTLGDKAFHLFQLHRLGDIFNAERGLGGLLKRFHSGGGGGGGLSEAESAAGAAGQGGGGFLGGFTSFLPNSARGALIGGGIGLAASMLPGLLGLGIGGLVGAGGLYGAYKLDPKAFATVKKSLSNAFLSALTSRPQGIGSGFGQTGKMGPFGTGGQSFLGGIKDMLGQLNGFIKQIGPELGGMFRASLPILNMFIKSFETLVRLLMPAFISIMTAIRPELPMFQQGFKFLSQGIADFIKNLGPGMKSAGIVFKAVMDAIKGILIGASYAIVGFDKFLVWLGERIKYQVHSYRVTFDDFRHRTAVVFDGVRHEIAHIWDMIFQNTIGRLQRGIQDWNQLSNGWGHDIIHWLDDARHWFASGWDLIWNNTVGRLHRGIDDAENLFAGWRHNLSSWFDNTRHFIASAWDTIWNNTIGRVKRGISDVVGFFGGLPGKVTRALLGLGTKLWNLGKTWLTDLWNGIKSVWSGVIHWFEHLPSAILHAIGIKSPPKWAISAGQWIMKGLHLGMSGTLHTVLGFTGSLGGLITKGLGGLFDAFKGNTATGSIAKIVETVLAITHSPPGWLSPLIRLVNFESGGRAGVVNPISVGGEHATGFWQMLPSTFAAYSHGGSMLNPIMEGIAALGYIKSRYGTPFNIPGLLSGSYHGYWNEGWLREPVLGFGMRSGDMYGLAEHGDEYVGHRGPSGGSTYNIYVLDPSYSDEKALQQIKTLRRYRQRHGHVPLGFE